MNRSARPSCRRFLAAALGGATFACAALVASAGPPPELRLPRDIVCSRAKDSPGPVVFSHATHVAIADSTCTGCHPAPFRMLKPARRFSHDEMNAGRSCGVCHDGKTATGVQDDCEHCHKPAPPGGGAPGGAPAAPASKGGGS